MPEGVSAPQLRTLQELRARLAPLGEPIAYDLGAEGLGLILRFGADEVTRVPTYQVVDDGSCRQIGPSWPPKAKPVGIGRRENRARWRLMAPVVTALVRRGLINYPRPRSSKEWDAMLTAFGPDMANLFDPGRTRPARVSGTKLTCLGLLLLAALATIGIGVGVQAPLIAILAGLTYLSVGVWVGHDHGAGQSIKVMLWGPVRALAICLAAWLLIHFIWVLFAGGAGNSQNGGQRSG